ncbi:alcohol dehydrogenase [Fodinicurvata sediminis]|uniref:alcohol dehydrogenase n=1 Tax=Fodinicurvata sediminis TaxID=1121832 RepID=UPI0003B5E783|nr:alcohol dehydrogenase [Fodinicurvata sediminis]
MTQSHMECCQLMEFGQPLETRTHPLPKPQGEEVLLRVTGAGVCHSDLHIVEGGYDLGQGRSLSFRERIHFPLTLGHETAGEVVALGPEAKDVAPGDSVLAYPWIGCGQCGVCRAGQENLCLQPDFIGVNRDGGYADHILVPASRHLVDIHGLDPARAAPLTCSGLTTYSALRKFGARLETAPTVIMGAGGLGLMALALMQRMGAAGAVVVEPDARRRQAALDAGAQAALDPNDENAADAIRTAVDSQVLSVLDLVGSTASLTLALDLLDKGGQVVVVGLMGGDINLPIPYLPMRALSICGSYNGNLSELQELVELVRQTGLPELPVECRPLHEAQAALEELRSGQVVGRLVLTPGEGG